MLQNPWHTYVEAEWMESYISRYTCAKAQLSKIRERRKQINDVNADNWEDPYVTRRSKWIGGVDKDGVYNARGRELTDREIASDISKRLGAALHNVTSMRERSRRDFGGTRMAFRAFGQCRYHA